MSTTTDLEAAIAEFLRRVAGLELQPPRRFSVMQLRDRRSSAFQDWAWKSGVYFFEQAGDVKYIGRALPGTGLRARVHNQCTSFGDPRWDPVIEDPAAVVGIVVVPAAEWYWTAALEPFLIARCAPPHNRRSC